MKLQFSRRIGVLLVVVLLVVVAGKFGLDWYFAVPEPVYTKPAPDELHDNRTTAELETLRFGTLDDREIQRQCEAIMQEAGWTHGATLSEILAAGARAQGGEVYDLFTAFRTSQVEGYSQKTKDPEAIRPKAQEALKHWAMVDVDNPDPDMLDRIAQLAQEAISGGSTDPLIRLMAIRYSTQPLDESAHKTMAELPEQLTSAGYGPTFRILLNMYRYSILNQNDALNRRLIARELIKDMVRYSDEHSSEKSLDRVNWYHLLNIARSLDDGERELLYRRLLISEKTSPFLMHMLAGMHYSRKAGNTRGGGFADSVAEDAWPLIEKDYSTASLHFRKAWILRSDLPHAALDMCSIANVNPGHEHWSPRNWFELTCRAQFDYMPVYSTMLNSLLPRWGGSHDDMLEFGEECAATKAFETPVPYKLVDCIVQMGKETAGGKVWESDRHVKVLTDFWAAMDYWGTENNNDRTAPQWKNQSSLHAAVLIRNRRYAEARAVLDKIDGPPLVATMLHVVQDPQLAASSVYALGDPEAEPLIEIEKRFGTSIPRSAKEEELDEAIKVVSQAKMTNQAPRATLYFAARENSLTQQKKFLSGEWVDLPFDTELYHWRIQDAVATVESPTSIRLSNLTYGDTTPLAIPRTAFAPPYELQVTLERIRGDQFLDRVAVNVGALSQAVIFGEPGGITFVIDDQPRVTGTYMPNGVQPQTYYLDGLGDKARMGLQIWTGQYRCFVDHSLIPLLPVSDFRANGQLSFGGNAWEVDTGEVRISEIRIRKMIAPSPPPIDASNDETIEYLTEVVELEPTNVDSRLQLGELLAQNQKLEEAIAQYEAVYKIAPEINRIHGSLGLVFLERGREQEALPLLISAAESKPTDPILDGIAWIYATSAKDSLRNGEESLRISTEICDRTQNQQWNYLATRAAALAELKRFAEAIELMQKVISSTPAERQETVNAMLGEFQKNRPWRGKATE